MLVTRAGLEELIVRQMWAAVAVAMVGSVVVGESQAGAAGVSGSARPAGVSLVATATTFAAPIDVALSPTGRYLMVLDRPAIVRRVDLTDESVESYNLGGTLQNAAHIAVDDSGNAYVSGTRWLPTLRSEPDAPRPALAATTAGVLHDNGGAVVELHHDTGFSQSVLTTATAADAPLEVVGARLVGAALYSDRNGPYQHLVAIDSGSGAVRDLYRPEYTADRLSRSEITSIVADPHGGVIADIGGTVSEGTVARESTLWRYDGSLTHPLTVGGNDNAGLASPEYVRIAGHTAVSHLAAVPDNGMIVASAGNVVRSFSSGLDPTHGYYAAGEWVGNHVDHPDRRLLDADGATLVLGRADLAAGASLGELSATGGLAVGDDHTLYVADTGHHRVVAVTPRSCSTTSPGWCPEMTPFEIVLIGDSFTAGNGAGDYATVPSGCYRSPNTWGQLAGRDITTDGRARNGASRAGGFTGPGVVAGTPIGAHHAHRP